MLKVMTWNLENLFPVGSEYGPKTEEIYEQKMKNLVYTITSIAPDVLAVQEIGSPDTFADLHQRLATNYSSTVLSEHQDDRGIRVGFLSRLQILQTEDLFAFPKEGLTHLTDSEGQPINHMGRGALRITIETEDHTTLHLATTHLKSKLLTYPGGRRFPRDENERARETGFALLKRTAEAVALRVYVNGLITNNNEPLILLGDLNDGPEAVTTQLLLGPEDFSLRRADKGDDVRLYNITQYIAPSRQYSRVYNKKHELIDHILVSHELIFHVEKVDSYVEPLESIGQATTPRREATFPDHAPIFAVFASE